MAKKPKADDYAAQKKYWYAKLKADGFNDIEPHENTLKQWNHLENRLKDKSWQATQEYYYMATHFLQTHKFSSEIERTIWEYHSNGISMRNISKVLKGVKKKYSKDKINKIIDVLRTTMFQQGLVK